MPTLIPNRPATVFLALALIMSLATAATASAKVSANLRVLGKNGKTITEQTLDVGRVRVPTSAKATCFGKGTAGSGQGVTMKQPTALGLVGQASRHTDALKPLIFTDAFSFGLGVCGIGGSNATSTLSWYLKVNHKDPERSGERVRIKNGDEVLWALAPYPYPEELSLTGPTEAVAGTAFVVRVFAYDDKGKKKPVNGAAVTGGTARTTTDGRTTVVLAKDQLIRATKKGDLPSNGIAVCLSGGCSSGKP